MSRLLQHLTHRFRRPRDSWPSAIALVAALVLGTASCGSSAGLGTSDENTLGSLTTEATTAPIPAQLPVSATELDQLCRGIVPDGLRTYLPTPLAVALQAETGPREIAAITFGDEDMAQLVAQLNDLLARCPMTGQSHGFTP